MTQTSEAMTTLPPELTDRSSELAETILSANYPSQAGVALVLELFASQCFYAGWQAGAEAGKNAVTEYMLEIEYTGNLKIDGQPITGVGLLASLLHKMVEPPEPPVR